jgi:hypothetical protein
MMIAAVIRLRGNKQWLIWVALSFGLLFLLFTRARQAWLGTTGALAFLVVSGMLNLRRIRGLRMIVGLGLASCVILFAALLNPSKDIALKLGGSKQTLLKTVASFVQEREENPRRGMWDYSLGIPINRVVGGRVRQFPDSRHSLQPRRQNPHLELEVHNDYLQAFLDLGRSDLIPVLLCFRLDAGARLAPARHFWPAAEGASNRRPGNESRCLRLPPKKFHAGLGRRDGGMLGMTYQVVRRVGVCVSRHAFPPS